ncbi:pantoate--beta-alanine ligase [Mesonia sp. HuA40]|uniref:pantoate--beta-alanine ligase n=1 Tax=Mesonia sp. HuA40 TaxID=2602761 RepID=UPI0011C76B8E|nr:pantoate--beta-alanine ligase [Mesonia sp. HuA40]TXK71532.1 pantoate--beta-alanine ligase [Mesonia sp. HuA40]
MHIIHERESLENQLSAKRKAGKKIGLVPTMGALHAGHLSLVEKAYTTTDVVVISIFVNPTQFNNQNDLANYPRTLKKDSELLAKHYPDCILFAPSEQTMYSEKLQAHPYEFGPLANYMEGQFRQGHFDGVGTIVNKLLRLVQPDYAFFGEKDYQQLLIIKKLVEIEKLPVTIIPCAISREKNGLARSSRNELLTTEQRERASLIFQSLQGVKQKFGTKSVIELSADIEKEFKNSAILELEYFIIANAATLEPATKIEAKIKYRAFIAAYAGEVRLIDNIALN